MPQFISIIIPILNEATHIGGLLSYLEQHSSKENIQEIIIVDGGSNDGSKKNVLAHQSHSDYDIKLFSSNKGRATQMNTGALHSTGNILYFLHADSFPPTGFDALIIDQIQQANLAGCFRMKFDSKHPWLRLVGWFTRFNNRRFRGGDQSLFISKTLFNQMNGFDEQYTIYEDNDLTNRLYDIKQFTVLQHDIITSPRCYTNNGTARLQYHFLMIHLKKFLGQSPGQLYSYYQKYIK